LHHSKPQQYAPAILVFNHVEAAVPNEESVVVRRRIQGGTMHRMNRFARMAFPGLLLLGLGATAIPRGRVEQNVVYGMYSGSALLLDVHYPAQPNGFGIVFIAGSGWNAPLDYAAIQLKESPQVENVRAIAHAGWVHRICRDASRDACVPISRTS
jgi:hypothetical protein